LTAGPTIIPFYYFDFQIQKLTPPASVETIGTGIANCNLGGILAMQSDTRGNDAQITYDNRETRETPRVISGATWATVALLALIVILGALFLNGFFASLHAGPTNHHQSDVQAEP
jgi:hypothetical protein